MNFKAVFGIIGRVLVAEAILLLFPMVCGIIYNEQTLWSFLCPAIGLFVIGISLSLIFKKDNTIHAKEGFVIVALCWILLSITGTLPFVISKEIPNFFDALFETVSGFSTTGATILDNVESLSKSMAFWRIFTHFIGGMGVLVFILAILPKSSIGAMHLFRAESPGPTSSKIVGKIGYTARILYAIYLALTIIETILLSFAKIGFYESLLTAFSTAGTGGFSLFNDSIAHYHSNYIEIVVSIFMFLFGVNFNVFFLIITGSVLKGIKSEEFITYIAMVIISSLAIAINIYSTVNNFGEALKTSFFQVSAISSTTGFTTTNINSWPAFSKVLLFFLTIIGASGGSTGGGMKVARVSLLIKSGIYDLRKTVNNREIVSIKYEGKPISQETVSNVKTFFILYFLIVAVSTLLLSFDSFGKGDVLTHLSSSITCISNVGPSFSATINPLTSFSGYSSFSKVVMSIVMLMGRLEILPMVILFAPRTWKKN